MAFKIAGENRRRKSANRHDQRVKSPNVIEVCVTSYVDGTRVNTLPQQSTEDTRRTRDIAWPENKIHADRR